MQKKFNRTLKISLRIKELFTLLFFLKEEMISSFRLGYSIKEIIMNALISNADNKILELSNVIFY